MAANVVDDLFKIMGGKIIPNQQLWQFPNGSTISFREVALLKNPQELIRIINQNEAAKQRNMFRATYLDKNYQIVRKEYTYYLPDTLRSNGPRYQLEELDEINKEALYVEQ